jgi:long-chain acyl-CoA synthetase
VLVVGENRPFIACVAVVNAAEWRRAAQGLGLNPEDAASLQQPAAHKLALERIAVQTKDFARYAMPRAVYLTREAWTIENALMTPTLKLKRNNLMARYAGEIESLYQSGARR